ncbi:DUF551 domain-containing protein [Rhizobium leguminosarum]
MTNPTGVNGDEKNIQERDEARQAWQLINTAPQDGTEILGYGSAFYRGKRYAPGRHIAWFDQGKWWGRDPDTEAGLELTHWQPLPPSPTLSSTTANEERLQ